MTERAQQLYGAVDQQIGELIDLASTLDDAALGRPCRGREKLGDGTVAALAHHMADNYERIAGFVSTSGRISASHPPSRHGAHRIPRLLRVLGHEPTDHGEHGQSHGRHGDEYAADNFDLGAVVTQLSVTRRRFKHLAELTDPQLDAIPPKDSFRFCDGQRTLDQVLANLLRHQRHQLDALRAAVSPRPGAA